MDTVSFRSLREWRETKKSFAPGEHQQYWEDLRAAAAPEHVGEYYCPGGFSDHVRCSCGWESPGYWDLYEASWQDWFEHVADEMGLIPKKCPCGKQYLPADEQACHTLEPAKVLP